MRALALICLPLVLCELLCGVSASARFLTGPSVLLSEKIDICHHDFGTNTFLLMSVSIVGWQHDHLQHDEDCCVTTNGSSWAAGGCNSKSCQRSHVTPNPALSTCQCMQGYNLNPTTHHCEVLSAALAGTSAFPARVLQQTTSPACPAGCADGKCDSASTGGGFRCSVCKEGMDLDMDTGTCHCHEGKYAQAPTDAVLCVDCEKGYYCAGGKYTAQQDAAGNWLPAKTDCPETLTTRGKRSTKVTHCVNPPGTKYVPDNNPLLAKAEACPPNTYGPGYKKQRDCVNCPPGYVNPLERQSLLYACGVPAGYYLVDPSQVAPCPKGQYKEGLGDAQSCQKCPDHVTTEGVGSPSAGDCKVLLRGAYAAAVGADGAITNAVKCPYNHYCPGGKPDGAFNPASPMYDATLVMCPHGSWTQHEGAFDEAECMIPPGFALPDGAETLAKCGVEGSGATASGSYRAEWKPLSAATSCVRCGDGISAAGLEQVTSYDLAGTATQHDVATNAVACYIHPGQGMYYNLATDSFWAGSCDDNNYGVKSVTYGLAAHPCRSCAAGMQTDTTAGSSSSTYLSPDGLGFTDPLACVTKPGHGYNGRSAPRCAVGLWNTGGNHNPCTPCGYGLSTADSPDEQTSAAACKTQIGYGYHDGAVVPCPLGTYNEVLGASAQAACRSCPGQLTTDMPGGDSVDDCDMCAVGFGGQDCNTECGRSGSSATYGPAGRPKDTECTVCPGMSRGFFFDYQSSGHPFTPDVISRPGAATEGDCFAEFAQIVDNAWSLGDISDATSMTEVTGLSGATVDAYFEACVAQCRILDCQFITIDYNDSKCYQKITEPATTNDWLAYKALLAGGPGNVTVLSVNTTAKGVASGSYTYYKETLGCPNEADTCTVKGMALAKVSAAATVQACVNTCVMDGACAAVSMLGVQGRWSSPTATVSSCYLVKGDSSAGTGKRSVTRASPLRMTGLVKVGPVGTPEPQSVKIPFDFRCPADSFINKYYGRHTENWPIAFAPLECSDGVTKYVPEWNTHPYVTPPFEMPATGTLATGCPGFDVGTDYSYGGISGLDFSICGGDAFGQVQHTDQLHCPPDMQVVGVFGTDDPYMGVQTLGVYCR